MVLSSKMALTEGGGSACAICMVKAMIENRERVIDG